MTAATGTPSSRSIFVERSIAAFLARGTLGISAIDVVGLIESSPTSRVRFCVLVGGSPASLAGTC